MALPAPELDTLKFQDIVDDSKRRIGLRCPEWTDHNVSDPGVTLIELFAYMTEAMLYRMNQVPERNYIKFLEMIGVSLESPTPAETDLRFRLTASLDDDPDPSGAGNIGGEITLLARRTVAATLRTETEDAVEFALERDLTMTRPALAQIVALPPQWSGKASLDAATDDLPDAARPWNYREKTDGVGEPFPVYSLPPAQNDSLCFGFDANLAGNVVELRFTCQTAAADGLKASDPSQKWEVWTTGDRWETAEVLSDTTGGFNETGAVTIALPQSVAPRAFGNSPRRNTWLRARYTTDTTELALRPGQDAQNRPPVPVYNSPPVVLGVSARTVGGTAPASNSRVIRGEELGESDGLPGQVFKLRNAPILPRSPGETIYCGLVGAEPDERTVWQEVSDFAGSTPDDRHFTVDSLTGEVRFGPNIVSPDGSARQYGAFPPKGHTLIWSEYRIGGGVSGNVGENQLRVPKAVNPYIAEVSNPRRALGGREMETLPHAKMRGQALLRLRDRAVTAEDFEILAMRGSAAVGRARCVPPRASGTEGDAGVVRVLLVPALPKPGAGVSPPLGKQLKIESSVREKVAAYLDERRLLTTVLRIEEPRYVFVSTAFSLIAAPGFDPEAVRRRVREKLDLFLHPLYGGQNGTGWQFERKLTLADLYTQIQAAQGVAFLLGKPKLFHSEIVNRDEGLPGAEEEVRDFAETGLALEADQLICSREHRVIVRAMNDAEGGAEGQS